MLKQDQVGNPMIYSLEVIVLVSGTGFSQSMLAAAEGDRMSIDNDRRQ